MITYQYVEEYTDQKGFDVVFDTVGLEITRKKAKYLMITYQKRYPKILIFC